MPGYARSTPAEDPSAAVPGTRGDWGEALSCFLNSSSVESFSSISAAHPAPNIETLPLVRMRRECVSCIIPAWPVLWDFGFRR